MGNISFYYLGEDEAYFRALQGEFTRKSNLPIEFRHFSGTNEREIQSLLVHVFEDKPTCVFVDFSKSPADYLHLARIIVRTTMEHKLVTVGLVDYLSPPEILSEGIATGVNLTYIKSPETFDVVYGVTQLLAPEKGDKKGHDFAVANLNDEFEAGIPVKIGYVHPAGLHFESDQRLEKGARIKLNLAPVFRKLVPSRDAVVAGVSETNVFYQFTFGVDAEFLFVDEFLPPEGMSEGDAKEKSTARIQEIASRRSELRQWLRTHAGTSLEKKAKVLVVDRANNFYRNQLRSDRYPYTVRCLPYFRSIDGELRRHQPHVIAFALDADNVPEAQNRPRELAALVQAIKSGALTVAPFIVVFNCKTPSKALQGELQYEKVMAIEGEFSVELLLRMADVFEKKFLGALPVEKTPETLYLGKSNPDSLAEVVVPITIRKLSECDAIFTAETPLAAGTNLRLRAPVGLSLHVLPQKASGKTPEYLGIIHALGEEEKQELRRFINSVFFRQHDAQLSAETEEFKKLNETKLQERLEELRKTQELAEAQKAADGDPAGDPEKTGS
jgi:hypothetical protein